MTFRDEAIGFELSGQVFGVRKLGEQEVLFVVEASGEFLAMQRVRQISDEFFGLDVRTLELVCLERTARAVPNFLEAFFQSMDLGNGSNGLMSKTATWH